MPKRNGNQRVSQTVGVWLINIKKQSTEEKTPNLAAVAKDPTSFNFFLNSQIQQKSFLISHILFTV